MAEKPIKATACKKKIKDRTGKVVPCPGTVTIRCSNHQKHLLSFRTGQCAAGWHEGIVARDFKNNPVRPCQKWDTCGCECHTKIDRMFAMSGQPRVMMDKSGYEPPKSPYHMPSLEERAAAAVAKAKSHVTVGVIESVVPGVVPTRAIRSFTPTPSGRTQKGELEDWVRTVCDEFLVEEYNILCTPSWVADQVAKAQGVKRPSNGATQAVFERWAKYGFATIERSPVRFVGYTADGISIGLDGLKLRFKQTSRKIDTRGLRT